MKVMFGTDHCSMPLKISEPLVYNKHFSLHLYDIILILYNSHPNAIAMLLRPNYVPYLARPSVHFCNMNPGGPLKNPVSHSQFFLHLS